VTKRRLPNWLKITLGVFVVLFALGAIFGKAPAKTAEITAPTSTPTPTATTSTPPVASYTVTAVVDGKQVSLVDSQGVTKTVQAAGLDMPRGVYCYGTETSNWATTFLLGKQFTIKMVIQESATLAMLTRTDGTDYATEALKTGHAKYVADGLVSPYATALEAAQTSARTATTGLWGPPCNGTIDAPAPALAEATGTQAPPAPVTKAAAQKTTKTTPAPAAVPPTTADSGSGVYFANCTEAKAAHAAPLHIGEPGYRPALDRDHDGIACE
jgi:endonuclease YncB( thermonuclease family)